MTTCRASCPLWPPASGCGFLGELLLPAPVSQRGGAACTRGCRGCGAPVPCSPGTAPVILHISVRPTQPTQPTLAWPCVYVFGSVALRPGPLHRAWRCALSASLTCLDTLAVCCAFACAVTRPCWQCLGRRLGQAVESGPHQAWTRHALLPPRVSLLSAGTTAGWRC